MWPKSRQPGNPFFWCGQSGDRRLTGAAADYLVRGVAEAVGIAGLHPHALRHTAATIDIDQGTPLPIIQAKLGHASVLTTMRYLHG